MPSDAPSTLRELRRFGFGAAVGLGLLALAAHGGQGPFSWLGGPAPRASVGFAALAVWTACAALLEPRLNRPLERALHAVARAIAFLTLIVFFFGVLTPVGVVARLAGHDPLLLRSRKPRDSYWRVHRPRDKQSYFHQS